MHLDYDHRQNVSWQGILCNTKKKIGCERFFCARKQAKRLSIGNMSVDRLAVNCHVYVTYYPQIKLYEHVGLFYFVV